MLQSPPTLWRRKYFHSNCVWLLAMVLVNSTLFAMRLIEGGQFCAKCTHITSFKFVQIALEHQDAICLAAQLGMHFTLCGCFENYMASLCLICTGLGAAKALQSFCEFAPQSVLFSEASPWFAVAWGLPHTICTSLWTKAPATWIIMNGNDKTFYIDTLPESKYRIM